MLDYQFYTIIGANIVLLLSCIGLMIQIHLHTDKEISANKQDADRKIDAITKAIIDFHGRLCSIEERNRAK